MIREKCLVCDSAKLTKIIDLGSHPFADTFIPESKISEPDIIYPLVCDLCLECGHVQTRYQTDPMLRYAQIEYSYTSSNSEMSKKHWDEYEKYATNELNILPNSLIVETGSNDGYLVEQFLKDGHRVLGVDPSPYMAELAKQRNIKTIVDLFGENVSKQILSEYGKADLIIANNIFNHVDNLYEFTKSVSETLNDTGSFIFEQPYWLEGLKTGKFDLIYHEHVNYFTIKSISALLERVGMGIKSVKLVEYHGTSLRVIAQKISNIKEKPEIVEKMIQEEKEYGTFNEETYKEFMKKIVKQRSHFMQKVHQIKADGIPIIAVGAAAKGNTFLNFYSLDNTVLDYVTDASPYKKGKYTPATRIPIVGDEIFSKYDKVYAIVTAWNIATKLKEILAKFNKNIDFLVPEEI